MGTVGFGYGVTGEQLMVWSLQAPPPAAPIAKNPALFGYLYLAAEPVMGLCVAEALLSAPA
ncbi:MAG: hypothetical protein AMXMBFR13_04090 [Phycisphaerae bacterium]